MERDFMGLKSEGCVPAVKEEIAEGGNDSAFTKSSGDFWKLSSKVAALPHFMSSKSEQDDRLLKPKSDILSLSGHIAESAPDIFDASNKKLSGTIQNFGDATMKQFVGEFLLTSPDSIPPTGTTEQWFNSKTSRTGAPAQLTIFYAGTVNVFNDIYPDMVRPIMILAGNGSVSSDLARPKLHVQAPNSKLADTHGEAMNQMANVPPCSGLLSPLSVSSHPIDQSGGASADNDDGNVSKPIAISTTLVSELEPLRMVSSLGSISATAFLSSAVPQARKVSLARFLEKRKERAMNSAPYSLSKKATEGGTPGSDGFGLSDTSVVSSVSVSTSKEKSNDI